ncbi:MAG: DUF418 domain-containing protein [Proteobacteria bacterium]|nr:DUF418 domain-containing protein [Pseudomonadota bacterium]
MTQSPKRLIGLDIARFIAFVGMVIVNFKIVMGVAGINGTFEHVLSGFTILLEGRAAASFVTLAGLGLGLAYLRDTNQITGKNIFALTTKRCLFLMALGLGNQLIFPADILHYYAVYFFFGVMVLTLRIPALIALIFALNIGFLSLLFTLDYDKGWDWETLTYNDFWTPLGFARNLIFNGWHPVIPWTGFFLFGMILARLPLDKISTQNRLIIFGLLLYGCSQAIGAVLYPALIKTAPELAFLASSEPIPPTPLYTLAGMGASATLIGLCLRGAPSLIRLDIARFIVPAGRLTLSLYLAHIVIGMGVLEILGALEGQSLTMSVSVALGFCLIGAVFSYLWLSRFKRGPLEALMRRLAG